MSQENVEVVRRAIEVFLKEGWDAAASLMDPEVRWVEMESLGPDASSYRGMEEARAAVASWTGMWRDYEFQVEQYLDAGDDVVVLARESGRPHASGVSTSREVGDVFSVRSGRIARVRLYGSWREALEAAGLSE